MSLKACPGLQLAGIPATMAGSTATDPNAILCIDDEADIFRAVSKQRPGCCKLVLYECFVQQHSRVRFFSSKGNNSQGNLTCGRIYVNDALFAIKLV